MKLEGLDLETLEGQASSLGVAKKRELASGEKPSSPKRSPLKRIGRRHHALALAVASAPAGKTLKDIAIENACLPSTLYRLCNDDTFKHLVVQLRADIDVHFESTLDKAAELGDTALDELQKRLDTDPDQFTPGQLVAIATMSMDRSGHGPSMKSELNVNVGFAQRLNAARERVKTIDVTPNKEQD